MKGVISIGEIIRGDGGEFRRGCFAMNIREKTFEFKYDISEDGRAHGSMSKSK